ncbi:hypothetical protein MKX01_011843 [Papaver californicum]|nr:hypothetical protein MKX01_011843 [Papaver californicum]
MEIKGIGKRFSNIVCKNADKDYKDRRYSQVVSNALDMKLRDDLEILKNIMNHRGLRTTGRRGKIFGVSKKR